MFLIGNNSPNIQTNTKISWKFMFLIGNKSPNIQTYTKINISCHVMTTHEKQLNICDVHTKSTYDLIINLDFYSDDWLTWTICFKVQFSIQKLSLRKIPKNCLTVWMNCYLGQVAFVIERVQGKPNKYKAQIKSNISCEDGIKKFVEIYCHQTNGTLRCDKKKDATKNYKVWQYYRYQHNTKYLGTKRVSKILARKPRERFKNTNCEYLKLFSIPNVIENEFPCSITIEWAHNHPVNSLQHGDLKMCLIKDQMFIWIRNVSRNSIQGISEES